MPNDLAKQLKQIPLFAELGRDDLKAVAKLVKRVQYPTRSEICRQGQLGVTAYFVESGELRVLHVDSEGIEQEVARLGPGEYFGETSLLLGEPRDATVEVIQDATLLYLNKNEFDQLLHERPSVLESLQMRPDVAKKRRARRFKWQDPDEVIVTRLRKHNAILIRNLAAPSFMLLMDLVGCWYLRSGGTLVLTTGGLLALIPLLFALYLTVDQYNDNYILTNKRVVHEERVPLMYESRAEAPLRTVQDIQQSQEGLLAQLFNFGDLIIETAGERGHVIFRQIPNPAETQDAIFEQIRRVQAGTRAEERAAIRDALRRQFGIQSPEKPATGPQPSPKKRRFELTIPRRILAPLRIFAYFLPSLRHEQGDTITWRKHWIALVRPIAVPTTLTVAATLITIYLAYLNLSNLAPILIGYGVLMVFLFPWWLWKFDDWQNDTYQVTATRIIDVEQRPFYLREQRREASLGKIQNVSLEIPGVLGKLLNYGSVTIETAGAEPFTFDCVKNPRDVQAEIFRRVEMFQQLERQEEAERRRAELIDWFTVYDQIDLSKASTSPPPSSDHQET
jgi:CRP-like cAMP-binding protein